MAAGVRHRPRATDNLAFHRLPGHELDLTTHSTLFSGEQSNSSVAFGEDSLMKVFRKVTPGHNPDIEIHAALTEAGNDHVAALYGWVEARPDHGTDDEPLQLAMLQQFLRTASDGWDLALASVRDLYAEADLHADEVGGDFAAEAHRLGVATGEVHRTLRRGVPHATAGGPTSSAVAGRGDARRGSTPPSTVVPELAPHADALRSTFDAVERRSTSRSPVQRVHGDLHLGQTLRTVKGWKIVDFEGEPAKPLAERVLPDCPWRDVAGMLRSFDYAAHAVEADVQAERRQRPDRLPRGASGPSATSGRSSPATSRPPCRAEHDAGRPGASTRTSTRTLLPEHLRTLLAGLPGRQGRLRGGLRGTQPTRWIGIPLGAIERLTADSTDAEESHVTTTDPPARPRRSSTRSSTAATATRTPCSAPTRTEAVHDRAGAAPARRVGRRRARRHPGPARARAGRRLGRGARRPRAARLPARGDATPTADPVVATTPTATCPPSARWTCT